MTWMRPGSVGAGERMSGGAVRPGSGLAQEQACRAWADGATGRQVSRQTGKGTSGRAGSRAVVGRELMRCAGVCSDGEGRLSTGGLQHMTLSVITSVYNSWCDGIAIA